VADLEWNKHKTLLIAHIGFDWVALRGYSLSTNPPCAKEEGFDHYLVKPPKLSEVQNFILGYQCNKQSDGYSQPPSESSCLKIVGLFYDFSFHP
jgi:hypothetical protein